MDALVRAELDSVGVICVTVRLDPFIVKELDAGAAEVIGDLVVTAAQQVVMNDLGGS